MKYILFSLVSFCVVDLVWTTSCNPGISLSYNACASGTIMDDMQFDSSWYECDTLLDDDDTTNSPKFEWTDADSNKDYMVLVLDADVPATTDQSDSYWAQWIISEVSGASLEAGTAPLTTATFDLGWEAPNPGINTGDHRLQVFIIKFNGNPIPSSVPDSSSRGDFSLNEFMYANNVCNDLKANYQILVQD